MNNFFVVYHRKKSSKSNESFSLIKKYSCLLSYRSYLSILANIECPIEPNVNYSSTMFDVVKNIYQSDVLRPHIFGSLGTIAGKNMNLNEKNILICFFVKAGIKSTDLGSLSPELFNFFPSQALSRLPNDVFKSFNNEQLQNFNIEQIKTVPNSLLSSLNGKQMAILNQILYPFKSSG